MRKRVIFVECRCSHTLFKYEKVGAGKLIKCYLPRILEDYAGIPERVPLGTDIFCPQCKKRIGTIYGIRGVPAVKLNQGQTQPFRLG